MKWLTLLPALLAGFVAGLAYFDPAPWRLIGLSPDAEQHVVLGYAQLQKDSPDSLAKAAKHFEDAAAIKEHSEPYAALALTAMARAEALLHRARATPSDASMLVELATKAAQGGFGHAKKALMLDPKEPAAHLAMADYFRLKRAPDRMRGFLDAAGDDAAANYVRTAGLLDDPTKHDEAAAGLGAVLKQDPGLQRARFVLALLEANRGNNEQALDHLGTLLEKVPDHERAATLVERLGGLPVQAAPTINGEAAPELGLDAPIDAGNPGDAAADDASNEPADFDGLYTKANKLRRSGRARIALPLFERAIELQPESPKALAGKGWCQLELDQAEEAAATFRAILEIRPRAPGAHLGLADSMRSLGRTTKALKHYRRYLEITPDGAEAAAARDAIGALAGDDADNTTGDGADGASDAP